MLDLTQVQSFLAVIETGSYHAAARRLRLAQPTISQHIRKLEETVGVALVVRSRAKCTPTAKGTAFLPHARRLLRAAGDARAALTSPRLMVGAASNPGIYLVPPVMRAFRERFGESPRAELAIDTNPDIARRLQRGEIDIAIMEWWSDESGFEAQIWRSEPLVVIAAPGHPWAARATLQVKDLLGAPMIGGEPGTGTARILKAAFGPRAFARLKVVAELGSTEAVKHAVAAGLGISIVLAGAVSEEVAIGSLHALPVAGVELRKPLYVALPENTPAAAPAARFCDFLMTHGGSRPRGVITV